MKNLDYFSIFMIFLLVISLIPLYAVDLEINGTNMNKNTVPGDNNDIYVSTTGNDSGDGTVLKPFQTLSKAIDVVNDHGTIHVSNGIYTGSLNRNLTISKSVNITPNTNVSGTIDHVEIDANSNSIIFLFKGVNEINIQGIVFSNGKSEIGGGLAIDQSNVVINNCTFLGNSVNNSGGAIGNAGSLSLTNCIFESNTCTSPRGGSGGAIANYGNLNIKECTFKSNSAGSGSVGVGGAVVNLGNLIIEDSVFSSNSAGSNGAVGGTGGAINNLATLTINNTNFYDNIAGNRLGSNGAGGAISNSNGSVKISHSEFSRNIGGTGGGAIYCVSDVFIDNSNFVSNQAGSFGGAIVSVDDINITSSSFSNNIANYGAVMDNYNGTANVKDSTFYMNHALTNGGVFYNAADGKLTSQNDSFSENYAEHCGGGIFSKGTLTSLNDSILENTANMESGGGLENRGTATIIGVTIMGNGGSYGGGINNFMNMTLLNSTITQNKACINGGGISNNGNIIISGTTVTENSVEIINNTYLGYGGGIGNNGNMTLLNSAITKNQADIGGGIYNYNEITQGILYILNSNISNNTAKKNGGGLQNNAIAYATNYTINNNIPNNINGNPIQPINNTNKIQIQLSKINSLFFDSKNTSEDVTNLFKDLNNKRNYNSINLLDWNL